MPTIKYSDNPNEETAFVTQDGGQRNRAVLTAALNGTIEYPNNPNSTKVMVTVDGVKRRAVAVADIAGGGGGDQHNLGWYATESALTTAHPTATDGDWAIVGATDTVWVWDSDTTAWKDTDTKGQVTSVNGQTGAVTVDALPSQTGQSGKFLTTDGTDASWAAVNALQNVATQSTSLIVSDTPNTTNVRCTAFGREAKTTADWGVAFGPQARVTALHGVVLGNATVGGAYSIAVGEVSISGTRSIAIGGRQNLGGTITAHDTIVLGSIYAPQNINSNTFYVGLDWTNASKTFEMLSPDGTIPTARLTKVNSTITLTSAGWSSNTQTVSVTGITVDGVVMVSPDPTDQSAYTSAGVLCTAQAAGSLTFTCDTVPSGDLSVNIVML